MLGNSIKNYIAWGNCSVVDCNTGFFPQNQFLRARSLTCPSLTLRFHPPCTTFVSPLACFELRNNGLFCSLVRCKFCCFLRKAVRNGLSGLRTLQSNEHRPQTLSSSIYTFLYLFIHSRLEPWFMFIQTDQFLSLTEEQKWDKDYTLKWCRLVKKWKLKKCKKCLVMGKITDRYCVRHQKIVNKGFRISFDLSNFILFGIKRTEKLKNIHQKL